MIYWKYYVNKEYVMEQTPVKRVRRHKHISSKHNPFQLRLGEVWRYRDLIWLFTKRNFKVTYKQTILGPAWLFLHPLMTSVISGPFSKSSARSIVRTVVRAVPPAAWKAAKSWVPGRKASASCMAETSSGTGTCQWVARSSALPWRLLRIR